MNLLRGSIATRGLAAFLILLGSGSRAEDVISQTGGYHLEVTLSASRDWVSFKECNPFYPPCKQIGPKEWYSLKELKRQRTIEKLQFAGLVSGEALVLIFGGWEAYATSTVTRQYVIQTGVYAVGEGVGGAISDAINPLAQYAQARAVRDDVILDRDVQLESDEKVRQLVESLRTVLAKLD